MIVARFCYLAVGMALAYLVMPARAAIYNLPVAAAAGGSSMVVAAGGAAPAAVSVSAMAALRVIAPWLGAISTGMTMYEIAKNSGNLPAPQSWQFNLWARNTIFPGYPAGWPDSEHPPTNSVAPTNMYEGSYYCVGQAYVFPTADAAAACEAHGAQAAGSRVGCGWAAGAGGFQYGWTGGGSCVGGGTWVYGPQPVCPRGYTLSGSVCNLTDPSLVQWPSDGVPTYRPSSSGTTFEAHPRDPDAAPNAGADGFRLITLDPFGNPIQEDWLPNNTVSLGPGVTFKQSAQISTDMQTQTTQRTVTADRNATITEVSSQTYNAPISAVNSGIAPSAAAITVNVPPLNLPTDYARENTLQSTNTKLDTVHHDLTDDATHTTDPTAKTRGDIQGLQLFADDRWNALRGFSTGGGGECPTPTINLTALHMGSHTLSAHCDLFNGISGTIGAVAAAIWSIVALFIILTA